MYYLHEKFVFKEPEKGPHCAICGNRMVDEDDAILFDDKWYHQECFMEEYSRTFYEEEEV